MTRVIIGQEFALVSGHVDAYWTFGLARAALEAQVENAADAFVAQAGFAQPSGHRQAQDIGAAARRIRFLARGHIRRTHGAGQFLAAGAHAATHFYGASEAPVFRVIEKRRGIRGPVLGAKAEIGGHRGRIDYFSGVQDALRIEGTLDLAEGFVNRVAEHLAEEGTADQAVAVLARDGAAE